MERKNPFLLMDPRSLPHPGERPLEVCLLRGEAVESRHRVHVMVVDSEGDTVFQWGNPRLAFFPRSAVKVIQAAAWVSAGLDKTWELGDEELSIACGSHEGEEFHVKTVARWLEKLGLSEADLACGAHAPYHVPSAHALIRAGLVPTQLHNNCSGKHSGLLTCCLGNKWDVKGYTNYDHPLQEKLRATFSQFFDVDFSKLPWGIDGCGIPTYSVTLAGMALAMANLADPGKLGGNLKEAVKRLNVAVAAKPLFLGGTSSFCSQVMAHTEGRVLAKLGAEGVYGAWVPKAGIGLAMKCEDGNARASEVAMAAVLRELGHPLDFYSPLVRRWTGEVVGQFFCA